MRNRYSVAPVLGPIRTSLSSAANCELKSASYWRKSCGTSNNRRKKWTDPLVYIAGLGAGMNQSSFPAPKYQTKFRSRPVRQMAMRHLWLNWAMPVRLRCWSRDRVNHTASSPQIFECVRTNSSVEYMSLNRTAEGRLLNYPL